MPVKYQPDFCGTATPLAIMDGNGNLEWYGRCKCGWITAEWSLSADHANYLTKIHISMTVGTPP